MAERTYTLTVQAEDGRYPLMQSTGTTGSDQVVEEKAKELERTYRREYPEAGKLRVTITKHRPPL